LHGDLVAVLWATNADRLGLKRLVPASTAESRALYFGQGRRLRPRGHRGCKANIERWVQTWCLIRCHAGRRRRDFQMQGIVKAGFFVGRNLLTMHPRHGHLQARRLRAQFLSTVVQRPDEEGLASRWITRWAQRHAILPATAAARDFAPLLNVGHDSHQRCQSPCRWAYHTSWRLGKIGLWRFLNQHGPDAFFKFYTRH